MLAQPRSNASAPTPGDVNVACASYWPLVGSLQCSAGVRRVDEDDVAVRQRHDAIRRRRERVASVGRGDEWCRADLGVLRHRRHVVGEAAGRQFGLQDGEEVEARRRRCRHASVVAVHVDTSCSPMMSGCSAAISSAITSARAREVGEHHRPVDRGHGGDELGRCVGLDGRLRGSTRGTGSASSPSARGPARPAPSPPTTTTPGPRRAPPGDASRTLPSRPPMSAPCARDHRERRGRRRRAEGSGKGKRREEGREEGEGMRMGGEGEGGRERGDGGGEGGKGEGEKGEEGRGRGEEGREGGSGRQRRGRVRRGGWRRGGSAGFAR